MKKEKTTIHDIAEKLNITASTVSRALKDHPRISDATKKAVLRVAQKLNYQPNHIAAALRNGRSRGQREIRVERQVVCTILALRRRGKIVSNVD